MTEPSWKTNGDSPADYFGEPTECAHCQEEADKLWGGLCISCRERQCSRCSKVQCPDYISEVDGFNVCGDCLEDGTRIQEGK